MGIKHIDLTRLGTAVQCGGFKRLRHATDPFERLPLEHGSDRRENPAKRVSDDLQLSIFWRFFFFNFFQSFSSVFRHFRQILEELRIFWPQNQLQDQILLQMHLSWGLCDPKSRFLTRCSTFSPQFWQKTFFTAQYACTTAWLRFHMICSCISCNQQKRGSHNFHDALYANTMQ